MLVRFAPEGPMVMLRPGDPVDISAPDNFWGFVQGGKAGGPHLLLGGTSGSMFELGPDGSPQPQAAFAPGELITGSFRHTGSAIWNSRRGADGRLYVTQTSGYGVARKSPGGGAEPALAGNQRMSDGALIYGAYEVRVNSSGQMLTTQGSDRAGSR
jgi:hypothetical protein